MSLPDGDRRLLIPLHRSVPRATPARQRPRRPSGRRGLFCSGTGCPPRLVVPATTLLSSLAWNLDSPPSRTSAPASPRSSGCATCSRRPSWPSRSGLDVFAIGEHHRPDFLISSPAVALAAIAARTERIRLSSAVTVLSSDDPVRVFQQFAELDLISGGRAEIMAGRGSFIESFPLFGYDLDDYDELYAEKLELLLAIRASEHVTWSGRLRAPLQRRRRLPAPGPGPAARVGGGRRLAAVGRPRRHPGPAADAGDHRRPAGALRAAGGALPPSGRPRPATTPPRCRWRSTPTPSSARPRPAADAAFAHPYLAMMNRIGRERGWPPSGRPEYEALRSPRGAVAAGSPEQVAEKILFEHELFGNTRYVGQMSVGAVAHAGRAALDRAVRHRGGAGGPRRGGPAPSAERRAGRVAS